MELCQGNTQLEQQILQVILVQRVMILYKIMVSIEIKKFQACTVRKQITVLVKCSCAISGEPTARGFRKRADTYE